MYIAAGTGGGIFILIIIVICVCVVRTRRKGNVTQAISDADNGAEVSENPLYVTYQVEPVDNKVHFTYNTPEHIPALGGAVDVGDLYAVPDKTPKHQSVVGGAVNDGDNYAVPDKTPKHQSAVGGAVNIGDLYAVPDMSMKTKNGTCKYTRKCD
ncbi:uncharacterized protein LOC124117992 [Haliotis rufescens]|uniref:uncharacterized protein LOC124117992 n=1 Tax=Haliotis rufescens TaxID=6454 RepID=UPI00201EAF92|nr:uncharacterized protein LOC124117992 [Haliotis rufescens]